MMSHQSSQSAPAGLPQVGDPSSESDDDLASELTPSELVLEAALDRRAVVVAADAGVSRADAGDGAGVRAAAGVSAAAGASGAARPVPAPVAFPAAQSLLLAVSSLDTSIVEELASRLPRSELVKIIKGALEHGRHNRPFTESDLLRAMTFGSSAPPAISPGGTRAPRG